jgi:hypothetical protein
MTLWHENPTIWAALDHLIDSAWLPLKELLDVIHEYDEELAPPTKAMLFGGLGVFSMTYARMRQDGNPPLVAYESAMMNMQNDRRIQELLASTAQGLVDKRVDEMGGV